MGGDDTLRPPAREDLVIYWDGEEVAGFTVHALRRRSRIEIPRLHPVRWVRDAAIKSSALHGKHWEVCVWDVRIEVWPRAADFAEAIQQVLYGLIGDGFAVAWIGLEGYIADPPLLFAPQAMSGGVLAACSDQTGFLSVLDLDAPLQTLSDVELGALREASGELARSE